MKKKITNETKIFYLIHHPYTTKTEAKTPAKTNGNTILKIGKKYQTCSPAFAQKCIIGEVSTFHRYNRKSYAICRRKL